jgi:FixJ family two-component response regulator
MNTVGVVHLIDDDDSFLRGMTRLLCAQGFSVRSFSAASPFLLETSPSARGCIVSDLGMPDISGLELQVLATQRGVTMPMVFLTARGDIRTTVQAMRGGAADFLEKGATREVIVAAIEAAFARDADEYDARMRRAELARRFAQLTRRESEVLRHVVRGAMNKQIAALLGINERTVKLHRTAITTKLGVHSTARIATLVHESCFLKSEATPFEGKGLLMPAWQESFP